MGCGSRKQILKDTTYYLTSTILAQGVSLLRTFLLPVLLGPVQLGIWNLMNVIIGYGANSHLGILHGLNKKVPALRGLGQIREIDELKDSVFWVNLLLGIMAGSAIFIGSFLFSNVYAASLRIIALVIVLQMVFVYFFCLLRADCRFEVVSKGIAALSMFSTVLVLLLAYLFSDRLLGALWGVTGAYLFVIGYWFYKGGYRFTARLKWSQISDAFVTGIPLIVLGLIDMLLLSLDRWVIAWKLPATALGFYALGIMTSNLLGIVPTSVSNVLYPRMLESFAATQSHCAVGVLMLNPLRVVAVLMVFLISATTIFLPVIIRLLLPTYLPAVSLIEILVPSAFFLAIAPIAGNYVVAVDRQRALIMVQVVAMGICLVLDGILLHAGYGVRGIAYGTLTCYAVYGLGYAGIGVYLARERWGETLLFLIQLVTLFGVMLIALNLTNLFLTEDSHWGTQVFFAIIRLFVVSVMLLPFVWLVNRKSGMLSTIWMEFINWRATRSRSL